MGHMGPLLFPDMLKITVPMPDPPEFYSIPCRCHAAQSPRPFMSNTLLQRVTGPFCGLHFDYPQDIAAKGNAICVTSQTHGIRMSFNFNPSGILTPPSETSGGHIAFSEGSTDYKLYVLKCRKSRELRPSRAS